MPRTWGTRSHPLFTVGETEPVREVAWHTARGLQRALAPYPAALPSPVNGACVVTSRRDAAGPRPLCPYISVTFHLFMSWTGFSFPYGIFLSFTEEGRGSVHRFQKQIPAQTFLWDLEQVGFSLPRCPRR